MDFGLTDEQSLLQKTAREFVTRTCPPERAKEWDESDTYPVELFTAMADLGWLSLPFPESIGGAEGGITELCILAEELGRASLDVAMCYAGTFIPGLTLLRWGTPEQHERYLGEMMAGRARLVVAMSEPDAGSDVAALRTSAVDAGDHFVVNGQKAWCTGAGLPGSIIAMYVRTDPDAPRRRGLSLLLIDPNSPGVEVRRTPTLARHILGTNEVFLTDVRVPKENLVGPLNGGWEVMLSGLDIEKILMSAAYTGTAQATLDEALAYAREREAFGRPIGSFQSLAHALADLQTEIDAARLLSYRAAWLLAAGRACTREGAMAKLKGSETYVAAARWGMQILAGHGFSTESVMSFRWRESIVATISGGTSQIQRNAIARSMGLRSS
ncbi:acyl-CoA dehydrogenase [Frankia sp. CcI49]|uniref:acyl-CoA dehydrogenase family protein n=1 Tax=Frankia sp. CcI49 TaxID=1745382 RepID=UPI000978AD4D|nr:acyl-CoA dehydrogenase family protein [Frankia sp. CcI49]ONH55591.1 acyl-CoA dehydrogenase [Frankia sp. CcI49]